MGDVNELLDVLSLEPIGGTSFVGRNAPIGGGSVVFGGQILAQSIVAGATVDPEKEVKSLHTIFAKGASFDAPLELDVDVMAAAAPSPAPRSPSGRATGSAPGRSCC